jgi:hypothetical protein
VKGGSALRTADAICAVPVSNALSHEWGEALWTAPDLALRAFRDDLRQASVRWLFGLPARALDRAASAYHPDEIQLDDEGEAR